MAIRIECECGKTLKLRDNLAGRKVQCPECGAVLKVPAAGHEDSDRQTRGSRKRRPVRRDKENEADLRSAEEAAWSEEDSDRTLYKTPYGRLPKLMLYGGLPFLTGASIFLFIWATQFGGVVEINGLPISPKFVAWGIAPGLLLLVVGCVVVEINQRRDPRRVVLTSTSIIVPKGRLAAGELRLGWKGMQATISTLWFMTDVSLKNAKGEKARLNSMMFPSGNSFEAFMKALARKADIK